ncbi:MAG: deaminase [Arthrobacter sp.]|nr:deaminase [Arthrobacter sp.]
MGRLIYSGIQSLDGYVADRDGRFDWSEPDEEVHTFINGLESSVGTYLLGRRLYEVMLAWEDPSAFAGAPAYILDFAKLWKSADKVVYSRSLAGTSSGRTRLERDFDAGTRTWRWAARSSPPRPSGQDWSMNTSCSSRLWLWAAANAISRRTCAWTLSCWKNGGSRTVLSSSATAAGPEGRFSSAAVTTRRP